MGLSKGGIWNVNSDMSDQAQNDIWTLLDRWADMIEARLNGAGLPKYASPLFRPFSIAVVRHAGGVLVGFATAQGTPNQWLLDRLDEAYARDAMRQFLEEQLGQEVTLIAALPGTGSPAEASALADAADAHVTSILESRRLERLGDISGVTHLKPELEAFLEDHPDFDRNVFVMMPFRDDAQMNSVWSAIRDTLSDFGMSAHRADDRDYTGSLWSNIEVYLTCCKYGIAVFEQIEVREHNPNVALELGYMLAQHKRTLILKEQRLQNLPTDVIHRLYRPFDIFDIETTVRREVSRWVGNDLRVARA